MMFHLRKDVEISMTFPNPNCSQNLLDDQVPCANDLGVLPDRHASLRNTRDITISDDPTREFGSDVHFDIMPVYPLNNVFRLG